MAIRRNLMILALVCMSHVCVWADPILSYTETDIGGGFFVTDFTAVNNLDASSGFNLFSIDFQFPVVPSVLSVPSGWNFSQTDGSVEAFSTFPGSPPLGTDITPGSSLSGFSFFTDQSIRSIPFNYKFENPQGTVTVAPGTSTTTVPEPSPDRLVVFSALLVGGARLLFRRRIRESRYRRNVSGLVRAQSPASHC